MIRPRRLALIAALCLGGGAASADLTPEEVRQLQTRAQQAEEDVERLRARVQKLESSLAELRAQLGDVRNVAATSGKDAVSQEQLRKLVEQVRDLDKRRQEDNEKIVQQIKRLAEMPSTPPPAVEEPRPRGPRKAPRQPPAVADAPAGAASTNAPTAEAKPLLPPDYQYYDHVVAEGQTLGEIIALYNQRDSLKIRLKHVLEANPRLRPERLVVGKTIRIPIVK